MKLAFLFAFSLCCIHNNNGEETEPGDEIVLIETSSNDASGISEVISELLNDPCKSLYILRAALTSCSSSDDGGLCSIILEQLDALYQILPILSELEADICSIIIIDFIEFNTMDDLFSMDVYDEFEAIEAFIMAVREEPCRFGLILHSNFGNIKMGDYDAPSRIVGTFSNYMQLFTGELGLDDVNFCGDIDIWNEIISALSSLPCQINSTFATCRDDDRLVCSLYQILPVLSELEADICSTEQEFVTDLVTRIASEPCSSLTIMKEISDNCPLDSLICPYVSEIIYFIEFNTMEDLFSMDVCDEFEAIEAFIMAVREQPCRFGLILYSNFGNITMGDYDEPSRIIGTFSNYMQLFTGELGLDDVNFCADIDILSELVNVLTSLPCQINGTFATCRDDDRLVCSLFQLIEDVVNSISWIPDMNDINICTEQHFIEVVVDKAFSSICEAIQYLRDCSGGSVLCSYSSMLLEEFQWDYCSDETFVSDLIEQIMSEPCSSLIIMKQLSKDCQVGSMICPYVSEIIDFIEYNTMDDFLSLDVCAEFEAMEAFIMAVREQPCRFGLILHSNFDNIRMGDYDEPSRIICTISSNMQLLIGELGLDDINFCADIDYVSEAIDILYSLPCQIDDTFITCREDDGLVCSLLQIIEDVVNSISWIPDMNDINICAEQRFIEHIVTTAMDSPCEAMEYLRDCTDGTVLCSYSSILLEDFQWDFCIDETVVWIVIDGLMEDPCQTFDDLNDTCHHNESLFCSVANPILDFLDVIGAHIDLCYEGEYLMVLGQSILSNPCEVTSILSSASQTECGDMYSCEVLQDLLGYVYTLGDLPAINTVDICTDVETTFITDTAWKILETPCETLDILQNDCSETESQICPYIEAVGQLLAHSNAASGMVSLCTSNNWIEQLIPDPCSAVEIMFGIGDECGSDESILCDNVIPLTTIIEKMWPEIRDISVCDDTEQILSNLSSLYQERCDDIPYYVSSTISETCQGPSGSSVVCMGMELVEPYVSYICVNDNYTMELVADITREPCTGLTALKESSRYCSLYSNEMCPYIRDIIDFIEDNIMDDFFSMNVCDEYEPIYDYISSVIEQPCKLSLILQSNFADTESSYLLTLVSNYMRLVIDVLGLDESQIEFCTEQTVIWIVVDTIFEDTCEALVDLNIVCSGNSDFLCSAVNTTLYYLDSVAGESAIDLCYRQEFLLSLGQSIMADPCETTRLLSNVSNVECGESYSCKVLQDLLVYTYMLNDLPDINTVDVCNEVETAFITNTTWLILETPCQTLDILQNRLECSATESQLCVYLETLGQLLRYDDAAKDLFEVCSNDHWIDYILSNLILKPCNTIEIMFEVEEDCKNGGGVLCDNTIPLATIIGKMWPGIRDISVCDESEQVLNNLTSLYQDRCDDIPDYVSSTISETCQGPSGDSVVCQGMKLLEPLAGELCSEYRAILNGVGNGLRSGLSVYELIVRAAGYSEYLDDMLNALDELLLDDMFEELMLDETLSGLDETLSVLDGDWGVDTTWLDFLASLLENPDDDGTGVFSIIGTVVHSIDTSFDVVDTPCDMLSTLDAAFEGCNEDICVEAKWLLYQVQGGWINDIGVCEHVPNLCVAVSDFSSNPCWLWTNFTELSILDVITIPIPAAALDYVDPVMSDITKLFQDWFGCPLDGMIYFYLETGLKSYQQQNQLQAWFGLMTWQTVAEETDLVFDVLDIAWPIVKFLGLACDSPGIYRTYTGLWYKQAHFNFTAKGWEEGVTENSGADMRNHFIKYGLLDKFYYDKSYKEDWEDMLKPWDTMSQSFLHAVLPYLPFDFQYVGSTWFDDNFDDFTTMLQLNLYSSNELNYWIEYYVTYFIEEYGLYALHYVNEVKYGVVTALSDVLPEVLKTNLTLSLDTYYEPVCDVYCYDRVVYYEMVLQGTNLCEDWEGQVYVKRMLLEKFSQLFPCASSNGCKPRIGSCYSFNGITKATWAVRGVVDGYNISVAEAFFSGEDTTVTMEEVPTPTVCEEAEYNYGGDCKACSFNTYQNFNASSSCYSCSGGNVTAYSGGRYEAQCREVEGVFQEGLISVSVSLDTCSLWEMVYIARAMCSADSSVVPEEWCSVMDSFYKSSKDGGMSEEYLWMQLGSDMCETGLCSMLSMMANYYNCPEGNTVYVTQQMTVKLPVPHVIIQQMQPYVAELMDLVEIESIEEEAKNMINVIRPTILETLQENRDSIVTLFGAREMISDYIGQEYMDILEVMDSNWDNGIDLMDYGVRTLQSLSIAFVDGEFEDDGSCRPGYGSVNGTCISCSPGQFSSIGTFCEDCTVGTYSDRAAAEYCTVCPEGLTVSPNSSTSADQCRGPCFDGYYPANSDGACVGCPIGTYGDLGAFCEACPAGTYNNGTGVVNCTLCPDDLPVSPAGSTSTAQCRGPCDDGYYPDASGVCIGCPDGTFGRIGAYCDDCPGGTYNNDTGVTVCTQCPEDLPVSPTGSTTIAPCRGPCDDGYYPDSSGNCVGCPTGTYGDLGAFCYACPAGTYNNETGVDGCIWCPEGRETSPPNSTTEDLCRGPCNDGWAPNSLDECTSCRPGTYSQFGAFCLNCESGTYGKSLSAASCTPCPDGLTVSSVAATSSSQCTGACDAGSAPDSAGACATCPAGTYSTQGAVCEDCESGTYNSNLGALSCTACPGSLTTSPIGSTSDSQCSGSCSAGSKPTSSGDCTECSLGSYSSVGASCEDCAPGTYSNQSGASSCTPCPGALTASPSGSTSASECRGPCNNGWAPDSGGACVICAEGSFSSLGATCEPCENGTYVSRTGASSCSSCPDDAPFSEEGATSMDQCRGICADGWAPDASDQCLACPPGTYSSMGAACLNCTAGTYNNGTGAANCTACHGGLTDSAVGSTSSEHCRGICENGWAHDNSTGRCDKCPTGTFSSHGNICENCTSGTYMHTTGAENCTQCPELLTESPEGSTSVGQCTGPCDEGYGPAISGSCEVCPAGTFSADGEVCHNCTSGSYASGTASPSCTLCPAGHTESPEAATDEAQCRGECDDGWAVSTATGVCAECPYRTFSAAGAECEACGAGTYNGESGAQQCTDCGFGYGSDEGAGQCFMTDEAIITGINTVPEFQYQLIGSKFSINCTFTTNFLLADWDWEISWSVTAQNALSNAAVNITLKGSYEDGYDTVYVIDSTTAEDSGSYTCSPGNGSVSDTAVFTFYEEMATSETVYLVPGADLSITCYNLDENVFGYNVTVDGEEYSHSVPLMENGSEDDNSGGGSSEATWSRTTKTVSGLAEPGIVQCRSFADQGQGVTVTAATTTYNVLMYAYTDETSWVSVPDRDSREVNVTCYKPMVDEGATMLYKMNGFALSSMMYTVETVGSVTTNAMDYDVITWCLKSPASGDYTCESVLAGEEEATTSTTVTLLVGAASLLGGGIVSSPSTTLVCFSDAEQEAEEVEWYREGELIDSSLYSTDADGNDALEISSISTEVATTYMCSHVYDGGRGTLNATADVLYVEFTAPPALYENTGHTLNISCQYSSSAVQLALTWVSWTLEDLEPAELTTTTELTTVGSSYTVGSSSAGDLHTTTLHASLEDGYELMYVACVYSDTSGAWPEFEKKMGTVVWRSEFVVELEEETYVTDGPVTLQCQFGSSHVPLTAEWGVNDVQDSNVRTSMESDYVMSSTTDVQIDGYTTDTYTCSFTDTSGTVYTSNTTLVYVAIAITSDPDNTELLEITADSAVVTCSVTTDTVSTEYVKWYKDDVEIFSNNSKYTIDTEATTGLSLLTFDELVHIVGTYHCKYEVGSFEVSDSAYMYPNDIIISNSTTSYLSNTDAVSLTCSYYTHDTGLTIYWFFNGLSVSNMAAIHTTEQTDIAGGVQSVLTLDNFAGTTLPSNMTYYCSAKSSTGTLVSESKTFMVRLAAPGESSVVCTSSAWRIKCTLNSEAAPTTIEWHKGAQLVSTSALRDAATDTTAEFAASDAEQVYYLDANSTSSADSSLYTCTFTFESGPSASAVATVTVRLVEVPDYEVYAPGDTVLLSCTLDSAEEELRFEWYQDETLSSIAQETTPGNYSAISITSATADAGGVYQCKAVFSEGDDSVNPSGSTTVFVHALTPDQTEYSKGGDEAVKFACTYEGHWEPASVSWIKDNVSLSTGYTSSRSQYSSNEMTMGLKIAETTLDHAGLYTCQVTVQSDTTSVVLTGDPIQLSVSIVSLVSSTTEYHYITEGNTTRLQLFCQQVRVGSEAATTVTWYKDIVLLVMSDGVITEANNATGADTIATDLTIHDPEVGDSGTYVCQFDGRAPTESIQLFVREIETNVTGLGNYLDNTPIQVMCTIKFTSAAKCSYPMIYKDGSRFTGTNYDKVYYLTDGVYTNEITHEIPFYPGDYDGNYYCKASCKKGPSLVSDSYDVAQQYIGLADNDTSTEYVSSAGKISRTCTYQGAELPTTATWTHNGAPLDTSNSRYSVSFSPPSRNSAYLGLKISSPDVGDEGNYTCSFGFSDGTSLARAARPVIVVALSGMDSCTVTSDATVTLTCVYEGSADFDSVAWTPGSIATDVEEGTYDEDSRTRTSTVTLASAASGKYKCVVTVGSYEVTLKTTLKVVTVEVTTEEASLSVFVGSTLLFACEITNRMFSITWFVNGVEVTDADDKADFPRYDQMEYEFDEVSAVTCQASLYACGERVPVTSTNTVNVTTEPLAFSLHPANAVIVDNSVKFSLTCASSYVSGGNIKWYSGDDQFIGFGKMTYDTENSLMTSTNYFRPQSAEDSYKCQATYDSTTIYSDLATITQLTFTAMPADVISISSSWVAFSCSVSSPEYSIILVDDPTYTGVGAAVQQGDGSALITISDPSTMAGSYQCAVEADNGFLVSDAASLINGAFSMQPTDKWGSVGSTVYLQLITSYSDDSVVFQKSDDGGSTWSGLVTSSVSQYRSPFEIHEYRVESLAIEDAVDYRAKVEVAASELNGGGVVYSDEASINLRQITALTWSVEGREEGQLPELTDTLIFTCTLASHSEPTSMQFKWAAAATKYYGGDVTQNGNIYQATKSKAITSLFGEEISCGAWFGSTYAALYNSMTFETQLNCSQFEDKANADVEYYEFGGDSMAKVECQGDDTVLSDPQNQYAVCDSSIGTWNSTLTFCLQIVEPPSTIEVSIGFNAEYCTDQYQIAEVVAHANHESCGFRDPNMGITCYAAGTCSLETTATDCSVGVTDDGGAKFVISATFNYLGDYTQFTDVKSDIESSLASFSTSCATDRRRRRAARSAGAQDGGLIDNLFGGISELHRGVSVTHVKVT